MGNGPKSWSKAKLRQKRPKTTLATSTAEQNVGRLPRQVVSRPAPAAPPPQSTIKKNKAPLRADEKRLRALNKVLRDIEELQRREAAGDVLDAQQQAKLDRLDDVLAEMEALM